MFSTWWRALYFFLFLFLVGISFFGQQGVFLIICFCDIYQKKGEFILWFSLWLINSHLFFIFSLSIRDGQCPEFNVEEQAICAVGLAKSKPGIFIEAIQYVLILATPIEVWLVSSVISVSWMWKYFLFVFCSFQFILLQSKFEYLHISFATDACCWP